MAFEDIRIAAGGVLYAGWKSVSVRAGKQLAARTFDLTLTEVADGSPFARWPLFPGTPVEVLASGSLLVSGYVDVYAPSIDAGMHDVQVSGRGRGADYVDCSPKHPTGRFDDKTVDQIARELDRYGVGIRLLGPPGPPIPWFQIRRGSTCWAELMRLLPQRGLTTMGEADGSISLVKQPTGRHAGGLIEGRNIKAIAAELDGSERFSDYEVLGQSAFGTDDPQIKPHGRAIDPNVKRFRLREAQAPTDVDPQRTQEMAETLKTRAAAWSTRASVTVSGFRDGSGQLWEPNRTVFVHAPSLHLEQDMTIEEIEFRQEDGSGTTTTLSLVGPEYSFGAAPPHSGSDPVWRLSGR